MFENYKIKVITPAGRKPYLEILESYILRNRPLVDKWILWVNTPHEDDIKFIHKMRDFNPTFIDLIFSKISLEKGKSRPQNQFFPTAIDADTIYLKFDDDICWIADDAIENLVKFRLENREPLFVSANVIMNGMTAHIHQKYGSQDFFIDGAYQRIPPDFGNKVWSEVPYAEYVHKTFLNDLVNNDLEKYKFDSWKLDSYQRIAINAIAWMGSDFVTFEGIIPHVDEELWLSCIKAKELKRPNIICGKSLVSHYAFYKHRKPFVVGKEIDSRILKAYKYLSNNIDKSSILRIINSKIII